MARCATGAGRRSGALSRGDRDVSLSLSLAACDSQRAITTRALHAPVDASSVASGRRRNETEPGAVGKANRGAVVSIAAHLLPPRSAPARRGARSAEAVVRASADMLSGDECGEPRARSCACRCGHALVTEKVTAGYYRVSTRVRGLSGSQSPLPPKIFLRIKSKETGRLVAVQVATKVDWDEIFGE